MGEITALDPAIVLEEIRSELRALSDRVARLEAGQPQTVETGGKAKHETAGAAIVPEQPKEEPISEEILLVISAAVAAFLGERAHIRQVRLIRSPAWAQQGRVSIQASHHLQH